MSVSTITFSTFVIRDASGEVDVNATEDKFHTALLEWQAERDTEVGIVSGVVEGLMDQLAASKIRTNKDYVVSTAISQLKPQPENYKVLTEMVKEYVKSRTSETRVEGGENLFRIARGRAGGICRWKDFVDKEEKPSKK